MEETRYEPLSWTSAIDIDEESDFLMARVVFDLNERYKNLK